MKSIKTLVQEVNVTQRRKEYDAYNILDDNIFELLNRIEKLEAKNLKYHCRVHSDANQAIPTGPGAALTFNVTEYPQFGNMHDNTIDNTKIFIKRNGVYHVSAEIQWEASAAGTLRQVQIRITRNAGTFIACSQRIPNANIITSINCATSLFLYRDDYVEVLGTQDSGGPLNSTANYPRPFLEVTERMEDLYPSEYGLLDPNKNMR
jgi:hypothetical protein